MLSLNKTCLSLPFIQLLCLFTLIIKVNPKNILTTNRYQIIMKKNFAILLGILRREVRLTTSQPCTENVGNN